MERWFLTSHKWAAITQWLKEMCGLENYERVGTHKEAGPAQMKRDQEDTDRLNCFKLQFWSLDKPL